MVTSAWHILALVLSIGFAFLFYYIIKLVIQLQNTLKTVENTLSQLQNEVLPVISNVEGITGNFEQITGRADEMIETVQNKAVDTMGVIDSLKNNLDIFRHTFFLLLNHFYKYLNAWGIGFRAGVEHFKYKSVNPAGIEVISKQTTILSSSNVEIIDHLITKPK